MNIPESFYTAHLAIKSLISSALNRPSIVLLQAVDLDSKRIIV